MNVYHDSDTNGKYPVQTFKDPDGSTLNPKDIILDNNGRAVVYVNNDYRYRLEVFDKDKNLLWTTDSIQPSNGVAIEGTYVLSIRGDEYISVNSETVGQCVNYDLSLSPTAKGAIDGFYDSVSGNEALYNAIQTEIQNRSDNDNQIYNTLNASITNVQGSLISETMNRQMADNELRTQIAAAKTEVKNTDGTISVQEATASDGHTIYTIAGIGQAPNVSVQSSDQSITVTETTQVDSKIFDLSIASQSNEYGKFYSNNGATWTKVSGNINVSNSNIALRQGGVYHITAIATLSNSVATEDYYSFDIYTGDSLHTVSNVDCSITGTHIYELSWDQNAPSTFITSVNLPSQYFTLTSLFFHIHRVDKQVGGGGGSSNNDKVAVDSSSTAGYLEDVLKATENSDIQISKLNGKLYLDVLTPDTSDPKLSVSTIDLVDSANDGTNPWNVHDVTPGNHDNHNCYIYKRLADAKGQVTKVDFAVGTVQLYGCIQIGIFDLNGNKLGETAYTNLTQGSNRHYTLPLTETSEGSLYLQRNTLYYVEVVYKGLEIIGQTHTAYYLFDYTMAYNRYGYCGEGRLYDPTDMSFNNAANILYFLQFSGD